MTCCAEPDRGVSGNATSEPKESWLEDALCFARNIHIVGWAGRLSTNMQGAVRPIEYPYGAARTARRLG